MTMMFRIATLLSTAAAISSMMPVGVAAQNCGGRGQPPCEKDVVAPPSTIQTEPPTISTESPATSPTPAPSATASVVPTGNPTLSPTAKSSFNPTDTPTNKPSDKPTNTPTPKPTDLPTATPTTKPTDKPTDKLTNKPTGTPTHKPTDIPTATPTTKPTNVPIVASPTTAMPTSAPTTAPVTAAPTAMPTAKPTTVPTAAPTTAPTTTPTSKPSTTGSDVPTVPPTAGPTMLPSVQPTAVPTTSPTVSPTETAVTAAPTTSPTNTSVTTLDNTAAPTAMPTTGGAPSDATDAPTADTACESSNGVFGTIGDTTESIVVEFGYELETTSNETEASSLILPILEEGIIDSILADTIPSLCGGRRLRATRRLEVVGVSKNPTDEFVTDVTCDADTMVDPANSCFVVSGALTLHTDGENTDQHVSDLKQTLETQMASGAFTDLDGVVRVSYVELDPTSTGSSGNRGTGDEDTGPSSSNNSNGVTFGMVGAVAGAWALLIGGVFYARKKRAAADSDAETDFAASNGPANVAQYAVDSADSMEARGDGPMV